MLSTPKNGWSTITIGDWSERCSYLDDVPFDLLNALEESCRTHTPKVVKFDAEGWYYLIVFDWLYTYIIDENTGGFQEIEIDRDDIARELINNIRQDLDLWANWLSYDKLSPDQIEDRKLDLESLCTILETRLSSDDYKVAHIREGLND